MPVSIVHPHRTVEVRYAAKLTSAALLWCTTQIRHRQQLSGRIRRIHPLQSSSTPRSGHQLLIITHKECALRIFIFTISLAVLLYGLFRPESPPDLFNNSDKFMHVLGFGAVSLAARLAFIRTPAWLLWSILLLSALLSEWLQHLLQPHRQFSWLDIAANSLGVVLAALGCWLLSLCYKYWQARNLNY